MRNHLKLQLTGTVLSLTLFLTACTVNINDAGSYNGNGSVKGNVNIEDTGSASDTDHVAEDPEADAEKTGDVYILFTSDIHCGVDQGFGLAGLEQVRDTLEAQGNTTILVDDGDSVQGEPIGTLTRGEAVIKLMNEAGYDLAIPGNHDFDYGMDRFLELVDMAGFPYICCNFTYKDEPVFEPYTIIEAAGKKIGFVGVITPYTIRDSRPRFFQDENGNYVYGFMRDNTGERVYNAVQEAVDAARADGAEFVYVMGHVGNEEDCRPWTYADIIANTTGIDVFLDGHSHDTEQVVVKNKDGVDVPRSAVGTKLNCIGYSHITAEGEIVETDVLSWPNEKNAAEVFGIENHMQTKLNEAMDELDDQLDVVVAHSETDLKIYDPKLKDDKEEPVRIVRSRETNLGDLCADAYRYQTEADISLINGGAVRSDISKGDITYSDILSVNPFGNDLYVIEVTGQQILDALEWGSKSVPGEFGGFLQVSGLSYEIDTSVESSCVTDEHDMFVKVEGDRRVKNVMVGDEPLDPAKKYSLASVSFMLLDSGDGYAMFKDSPVLKSMVEIDNQALIDYIVNTLDGTIGDEYADPYGQGRIKIINEQTE
ncbi:MAG: bifunctional metallophosphatase/5'-nucleotidase [Lachnospiraceae bacterium]|nr:bifunctional metallophosphatase/5'-nucleotidase [Lachnospiraceae bacterium]